MPNWCENKLAVVGPTEEVSAFGNKFGVNNLSPGQWVNNLTPGQSRGLDSLPFLEVFIPTPIVEDESSEDEPKILPDWYEWRIENWGTKWDCSGLSLERRFFASNVPVNNDVTQVLELSFDTAWAPPEAGIAKISEMYPNLQFFLYFIEFGMGFEGYTLFRNGEVLEHDYNPSIIRKTDQFLEEFDYYEVLRSNEDGFTTNNKES